MASELSCTPVKYMGECVKLFLGCVFGKRGLHALLSHTVRNRRPSADNRSPPRVSQWP